METGISTKVGLTTAISSLVAAVVAAQAGLTEETIVAVVYATITFITVATGRYVQAVAQIKQDLKTTEETSVKDTRVFEHEYDDEA